jgi:hypothetical protein
MPDPLPSDVVAKLRTDPTAALAAALILAGAFPDLVSWAMRAFETPASAGASATPNANGNGHAWPPKGATGHEDPRGEAAKHDEALLELMRANPRASITEIIRMNGRPRNSTMASLERLEKAGRVEHGGRGKWIPVDPDLLEAPAPKPAGWVEPLSGKRAARHAADGRVRDEMSMA